LGERRPADALVDEPVGGEGDDEHVAELAGLLEVSDVSDVEQVEHPVAVDDPPALGPVSVEERGQFVERVDLRVRGHAALPCAEEPVRSGGVLPKMAGEEKGDWAGPRGAATPPPGRGCGPGGRPGLP